MLKKILDFNNQRKGKGRSRMLASQPLDLSRVTRIAREAKVSNHKVSHHSNLKILTPKHMLQRLSIVFAQV